MRELWANVFGGKWPSGGGAGISTGGGAGISTGIGDSTVWVDAQLQLERQRWMQAQQASQQINSYIPPRSFEEKVDYLISMLERFGPKIETMAKVYEAMNIPEEDKK